MKTLLLALTMIISSETFAAKCVITGLVIENSSCSNVSTSIDVSDAEACESFATSTGANSFFGTLGKDQSVVSTNFNFKDRSEDIKVKKEIVFKEQDDC